MTNLFEENQVIDLGSSDYPELQAAPAAAGAAVLYGVISGIIGNVLTSCVG